MLGLPQLQKYNVISYIHNFTKAILTTKGVFQLLYYNQGMAGLYTYILFFYGMATMTSSKAELSKFLTLCLTPTLRSIEWR